jgi:hypothetical protein
MMISSTMTASTQTNSCLGKFITLCGRVFRDAAPSYYPGAEYRGRMTDSCLGAFRADPDIFYKVHRNSEQHKNVAAR